MDVLRVSTAEFKAFLSSTRWDGFEKISIRKLKKEQ